MKINLPVLGLFRGNLTIVCKDLNLKIKFSAVAAF